VVEEHQREQPARLRFLGGENELAGEPDRLAGQVNPARVAGCVDEVVSSQKTSRLEPRDWPSWVDSVMTAAGR
jgi:hypothetical protein